MIKYFIYVLYMALALFNFVPQKRSPVLLTTSIVENLTTRLQSLKDFQKELSIETLNREIFGRPIKLNETIILKGLVRKKLKRPERKRSAALAENTFVSDITDDALLEKYQDGRLVAVP